MSPFLRLAAAALAVLFLVAPGRAEMAADQKKEIEALVHDYLLANPEVLEEAFKVLQTRREQAEAEKQTKAIAEKKISWSRASSGRKFRTKYKPTPPKAATIAKRIMSGLPPMLIMALYFS